MSVREQTARAYRRRGYTYAQIGRLMGVSDTWANALCNPEVRARLKAGSRAWIRSGCCPDCGGPMTTEAVRGLPAADAREVPNRMSGTPATSPPSAPEPTARFASGVGQAVRARRVVGETLLCRSCHERDPVRAPLNVAALPAPPAARQAYRERHKVPCVECGQPRLHPNETASPRSLVDTGMCRSCWMRSRRKAAG